MQNTTTQNKPKRSAFGAAIDRVAKALLTSRRRADTLLEDGYRMETTDAPTGCVHVWKPGAVVPYSVRLSYDLDLGKYIYHCDCVFYSKHKRCKHGKRVLREFLAALRLVRHITGAYPGILQHYAAAQNRNRPPLDLEPYDGGPTRW
jgi:hypothetical protein